MPLTTIPLSALTKRGVGLKRPEDVVVSRDGHVWASDEASACAEILPDGGLRRTGKAGGRPNGINMDHRAASSSPTSRSIRPSPGACSGSIPAPAPSRRSARRWTAAR